MSLRHPSVLPITAVFFAPDKTGLGGVAAYIEMFAPRVFPQSRCQVEYLVEKCFRYLPD